MSGEIDRILRSGGPGVLGVWRREAERRGEDVLGQLAGVVEPSELRLFVRQALSQYEERFVREFAPETLIEGLPSDWREEGEFKVEMNLAQFGLIGNGFARVCPDLAFHNIFVWSDGELGMRPVFSGLAMFCVQLAFHRFCLETSQNMLWHRTEVPRVNDTFWQFCVSRRDNYSKYSREFPRGDRLNLSLSYQEVRSEIRRMFADE